MRVDGAEKHHFRIASELAALDHEKIPMLFALLDVTQEGNILFETFLFYFISPRKNHHLTSHRRELRREMNFIEEKEKIRAERLIEAVKE